MPLGSCNKPCCKASSPSHFPSCPVSAASAGGLGFWTLDWDAQILSCLPDSHFCAGVLRPQRYPLLCVDQLQLFSCHTSFAPLPAPCCCMRSQHRAQPWTLMLACCLSAYGSTTELSQ